LEVDLTSEVAAEEILAPVDLTTAGRVVEAAGNLEVEVLSVDVAAHRSASACRFAQARDLALYQVGRLALQPHEHSANQPPRCGSSLTVQA
jgi:hypothetical protein